MEAVKAVFSIADTDGQGLIEKGLLANVLKDVVGERVTQKQIEGLIGEVAPTGSTIPYSVFLDFIWGVSMTAFPGLPGATTEDLAGVFSVIDRNGNGTLDKEEVVAALRPPLVPELQEYCRQMPCLAPLLNVDSWEKTFRTIDTNADNKISWIEFIRFFLATSNAKKSEAVGPGAGALQAMDQEDLIAVFACVDTNQNGFLEKQELMSAVRGGDPALLEFCKQMPALHPLLDPDQWEAAFKALDTNRDGVVSWDEFCLFFCKPKSK
eukprot:gnl/TRDRNA2_/TRDRNA2_168919_c1_seq6.p1 gnl/TRDRNA2_/TRDRNA2_168919_c1~~gnl/TRDRNA2_/TRDRNA2_168919_c1_seq6.p1  ORF type:complete len:266 (+),score=51.65 gnl/TRDRNA2_/TRDRNA2_168919_c1_seq6:78-875(+)